MSNLENFSNLYANLAEGYYTGQSSNFPKYPDSDNA